MADKNIDKETLKAQKEAEKAAEKAKKERIKASKPKKEGTVFSRGTAVVKKFCKDFVGTCKKVAWPTGKQVIKNSGVVLACITIVTVAVMVVDWGLTGVFDLAKKGAVSLGEQFAIEETTDEVTTSETVVITTAAGSEETTSEEASSENTSAEETTSTEETTAEEETTTEA